MTDSAAASHSTPRLIRNPDLLATDMDGDTVMMSIERGDYYGIGGAGTRVWELLEHPVTMDEIVGTICRETGIDEATCRTDMEKFIGEMRAHDVVIPAAD